MNEFISGTRAYVTHNKRNADIIKHWIKINMKLGTDLITNKKYKK